MSTKLQLTPRDRSDLCRGLVIAGVMAICLGVGLPELLATANVPLGLRTSIVTFGVIVVLAGLTRMHQAAIGTHPFKDDSRRSLLQHKD